MKRKLYAVASIISCASLLFACGNSSSNEASTTASSAKALTADSSSDAATSASAESSSESDTANSSSTEEASSESSTTATETSSEDDTIKVVFLGDSQFNNGREDGTSIADYVAKMTGTTCYNLGCGGTTASMPANDEKYSSNDATFVNIVKYLAGEADESIFDSYDGAQAVASTLDKNDIDYFIIEYGVNDYLNERQISNTSDGNDNTCYSNAMKNSLSKLQSLYPDAYILVCTPCYAQFWGSDGSYIGDGNIVDNGIATLSDYAANCRSVGETLGLSVFDAYTGQYMNLDSTTASKYLMSDGIHLTQEGRNTFAAVVAHFINKDRGLDDTTIDTPYDIDTYTAS